MPFRRHNFSSVMVGDIVYFFGGSFMYDDRAGCESATATEECCICFDPLDGPSMLPPDLSRCSFCAKPTKKVCPCSLAAYCR